MDDTSSWKPDLRRKGFPSFSGSFQYWRVPPESWGKAAAKLKELGFDAAETYIPWSVHELAPGRFDFGTSDPQRDVRRFIDICGRLGLKVIVRPGPHINAEITYFGFPPRILSDPDIACRCADGSPAYLPVPPRMFPIPCYHHPRFQDEFKRFVVELAKVLDGMLEPDGPVVAIQVDNECSKFFRTHPFDQDYSKYSILLYREFLMKRYGSLKKVCETYGREYSSWNEIKPPRRFSPTKAGDIPWYLDWVEYGEYYITEALRRIHWILRDVFGDSVLYFHNFPCVFPGPPLNLPSSERFLDFQGVDMYPGKGMYDALQKGARYVTATSRFPYLAEFASGSMFFGAPLTIEDHRFTSMAAVMHGFKGMNFYMAVERERWYGSPIRNDGTAREELCGFFKKFIDDVRRWGVLDLDAKRDVLLLIARDYERLADAACLLRPISRLMTFSFLGSKLPPDFLVSGENFGLSEPVARRYLAVFDFWYRILRITGTSFGISELNDTGLSPNRWRLVIIPTFEFMDRKTQVKLLDYVEEGGTLICGPRAPKLDGNMKGFSLIGEHMGRPKRTVEDAHVSGNHFEEICIFHDDIEDDRGDSLALLDRTLHRKNHGKGTILHAGMVPSSPLRDETMSALRPFFEKLFSECGVKREFVPADWRVDVSIFEGGETKVAFFANPTGSKIETAIKRVPTGLYRDLRNGAFLGEGEKLTICLEPYEIVPVERTGP